MSKRARIAAWIEYPTLPSTAEPRNIYQKGYEQAEKDIILEVKRWLLEIHRAWDITDEDGYRINEYGTFRSLENFLENQEKEEI